MTLPKKAKTIKQELYKWLIQNDSTYSEVALKAGIDSTVLSRQIKLWVVSVPVFKVLQSLGVPEECMPEVMRPKKQLYAEISHLRAENRDLKAELEKQKAPV